MYKAPKIRDATPTEALELEALQRRSSDIWEQYREQLAAHPDVSDCRRRPSTTTGSRGRRRFRQANRLLGLIPSEGPSHELDGLFVEPAQMRRGVGRALVEDAAGRARARRRGRHGRDRRPGSALLRTCPVHGHRPCPHALGAAVRMRRSLSC